MPTVGSRLHTQTVAVLLGVAALALPGRAVAADPKITVGAVTGKPGERVTLTVNFDPGALEVSDFQHDLLFDPLIAVARRGFPPRPDCWAWGAHLLTHFEFLPEGCSSRDTACAGIRSLLVSAEKHTGRIVKGTVYTCNAMVAEDVAPGRYPLACAAPVADLNGSRVPVRCVDGEVAVVTCLGDCSFDNQVTVNELLAGVNLALGVPETEDCAVAWDVDRDGEVRITDLIQGVNNALDGCGTARARAALSGAGVRKRRETREVANDQ